MSESRRKLSAILSADVVSYSRLMRADEQATLDTLNAYRKVFRGRIAAHDGRVVDTAGDNVLAVFDSVVEAIECAIKVQSEIEVKNASLAEDRRMQFRIGVNLGDVVEQDDGSVYGDGVNIAARLKSLALPSGITLSGQVHDFVEGKVSASIADIGEHAVKNIPRPVRVFQIEQTDAAARALYGEAIALDPDYGRAYASLAWTYITAYNEYWADEPQAALDTALKVARRGVEVSPSSHSNRLALGQVYFYRKQLDRALVSRAEL